MNENCATVSLVSNQYIVNFCSRRYILLFFEQTHIYSFVQKNIYQSFKQKYIRLNKFSWISYFVITLILKTIVVRWVWWLYSKVLFFLFLISTILYQKWYRTYNNISNLFLRHFRINFIFGHFGFSKHQVINIKS